MSLLALFGFIAPFIPEVLKLINRRMDNAQEILMFKMRLEAATSMHTMKLEEINATADVAEAQLLHKQPQSWGINMLDAAQSSGWPKWMLAIPFYLFVLLDWLAGMVRPSVTYAVVGFYIAVKWGRFELMSSVAPDMKWAEQITRLWETNDFNLLIMVLTYWFGNRIAKYAFGTDKR